MCHALVIKLTLKFDGEGLALTHTRDTGKSKAPEGSLNGFTLWIKDLWLEMNVDYDAGHGTLPGVDGSSDPIVTADHLRAGSLVEALARQALIRLDVLLSSLLHNIVGQRGWGLPRVTVPAGLR